MAEAREVLIGRLQALGHAHELLTDAYWRGADLRDVVMAEIAGFSERVRVSGPAIELGPSGVQTFALIVHELCTNAAKYGALSNQTGEVLAEWALGGNGSEAYMEFCWRERGGPPVNEVSHEGFGLSLITAMGSNPASEPVIDFAPGGFSCRIRVALDTIMPNRYDKVSPVLSQHAPQVASSSVAER
jgi:two-component sensor histidine kinase